MRFFLLLTIFLFGSVLPLAAQTENDSAAGFFKRGTQSAQRGDYGAAFDFYRKALEITEIPVKLPRSFEPKFITISAFVFFKQTKKQNPWRNSHAPSS